MFDVIVIGGGATGMGVAVEAASRGYKTILFEAEDFGKGTSSKSTKLVHGGIRYLANLDFALVHEGLSERYYFLRNAPHIAHTQGYLIPLYSYFDMLKYSIGICLYNLLSGTKKLCNGLFLSRKKTLAIAPELKTSKLKGGAIYYDGAFDDTRLLITLLRTFLNLGGRAHNYHKVIELIKDHNFKVIGIKVLDTINNQVSEFYAKTIINATGTFTDSILALDKPYIEKPHKHVTAAQGTHLVFDKDVFDSHYTLVIPKTSDGRILFVLPWHNKIVVGTTDIAISTPTLDPKPTDTEIDFILDTFNNYSLKQVSRADIRSVFAGQRPLVKPANNTNSAKISRKHQIFFSQSGIISIVGGKWTIYRLMGEDTIDFAIKQGLLDDSTSKTRELHLFGYTHDKLDYPLSVYGSDALKIKMIQDEINDYGLIHNELPYYRAEVIYHVRYEMAKTVEDILARRTRSLLLNAKSAIDAAPIVARLMAGELGMSHEWETQQISLFSQYAQQYLVE